MINVRDNYYVVDSVPPLGGPNLAVNPLDLLLSAQGSCAAVIMERASIDEGIPFGGVEFESDPDLAPHVGAERLHAEALARPSNHPIELGLRRALADDSLGLRPDLDAVLPQGYGPP